MESTNKVDLLKAVRQRYANAARKAKTGSCCGSSACCQPDPSAHKSSEYLDPFAYSEHEISDIPEGAMLLSLGCGNPGAIAAIQKGETVLDLGSGGGIDCFLAAKKVGDAGYVIGVDMTAEMVSRARENILKSGLKNIEFRLGEIENLPVADESVDVIISNCVINLSPDKPRVFSESFRVLKRGGRYAISDMVSTSPMPDKVKQDYSLYVRCVAGALFVEDLKAMLAKAGFCEIKVRFKESSHQMSNDCAKGTIMEGLVQSAMIEAKKPG